MSDIGRGVIIFGLWGGLCVSPSDTISLESASIPPPLSEQVDAAMKAHAGGGSAASHQRSPEPLPPRSDTNPSPTTTGDGRAIGKPPAPVAAVKKGFLDSGVGGGGLYGEEGSGEGGPMGGRGGRSNRVDREFERLVALADPDMGDGADGTGGKASRTFFVLEQRQILMFSLITCRSRHARARACLCVGRRNRIYIINVC